MKLLIILLLISSPLFARSWQKVSIPGAKCGNGRPYKVFLDIRDSKKLAVEFMGGGVCWSARTCYGPGKKTWLNRLPAFPAFSLFSGNQSAFAKHSMIYFPYCTGDVHAGEHIAHYALNLQVFHYGYRNIVKSLEYLAQKKFIDFSALQEAVLFGSSAGGIGAILHTPSFEKYLSPSAKKILIADSAGLHFGKNFWHKFSIPMLNDFRQNFDKIDLTIDENDGFIAPAIPQICDQLADWKIGFLQGSRDMVMSLGFGDISMRRHQELIYSELGVYELTKNIANCAAWVPDSPTHTFLLINYTAGMRAAGKSALEFALDIYHGITTKNYR